MSDSPLVTREIFTALHQGGSNGQITRVVIHATVSPCVRGGAAGNAHYFQSPGAGGAAHYIVDPGDVVQSVRESIVAHHAPPNTGSIGIELCDPQAGDDGRWGDPNHQSMLRLAAGLTADICNRRNIPVTWLSPGELVAGHHGITSHANVAKAFHKTDHTDPGDAFPVDAFLALVNGTQPTPEDDMTPAQDMILHDLQNRALTADERAALFDKTYGLYAKVAKLETRIEAIAKALKV